MGWRQEASLAAARVQVLLERIPEAHRPDVTASRHELMDEVERQRSDGRRVLAILEWREQWEARLAVRLANAPLKASR